MSPESQNLAVVFTDIAGFTEATAAQSRSENEKLIKTHNRILLPFVEGYRGIHVKSIGDSLLLAFPSPTDALLCSMAMQDALYSHNRQAAPSREIHIRIAVNVGEVRLTDGDALGDPVNTASRLESETPPDEIYFSEAVYMTMNKAEVPAEEVGVFNLKGIKDPVRVYKVPKFTSRHLTATSIGSDAGIKETAFPYGGAHLKAPQGKERRNTLVPAVVMILLLAGLSLFVLNLLKNPRTSAVTHPAGKPAVKMMEHPGRPEGMNTFTERRPGPINEDERIVEDFREIGKKRGEIMTIRKRQLRNFMHDLRHPGREGFHPGNKDPGRRHPPRRPFFNPDM